MRHHEAALGSSRPCLRPRSPQGRAGRTPNAPTPHSATANVARCPFTLCHEVPQDILQALQHRGGDLEVGPVLRRARLALPKQPICNTAGAMGHGGANKHPGAEKGGSFLLPCPPESPCVLPSALERAGTRPPPGTSRHLPCTHTSWGAHSLRSNRQPRADRQTDRQGQGSQEGGSQRGLLCSSGTDTCLGTPARRLSATGVSGGGQSLVAPGLSAWLPPSPKPQGKL